MLSNYCMYGKRGVDCPNYREKNGNWYNGLSNEPYAPEFNKQLKEMVRGRDNHTCQECKLTEKRLGHTLRCHHIDYDKKSVNTNNLIALCKTCHSYCHPQANSCRVELTKYFQEKV